MTKENKFLCDQCRGFTSSPGLFFEAKFLKFACGTESFVIITIEAKTTVLDGFPNFSKLRNAKRITVN